MWVLIRYGSVVVITLFFSYGIFVLWPQIQEIDRLCGSVSLWGPAPSINEIVLRYPRVTAVKEEYAEGSGREGIVAWADSTNFVLGNKHFIYGCHYTFVNGQVISVDRSIAKEL